ncbi:hypothetical protein [Pseudomonas sp. RIT-To-2]|uniref:hypothetical protein n=1 Tax=Pseudomonas sp. RIT-To-2 TaxID=3462541 RepID=UPI002413440E
MVAMAVAVAGVTAAVCKAALVVVQVAAAQAVVVAQAAMAAGVARAEAALFNRQKKARNEAGQMNHHKGVGVLCAFVCEGGVKSRQGENTFIAAAHSP